jgi:hypothetical protein
MSRTQTFFAIVFPSMLAGGVIFGSAFTHADAGRGYTGYWPSSDATVVAQADPRPAPRPVPTVPPAPPAAPAPRAPVAPPPPPAPHTPHAGSGVSVQIHDGKIQIDGVTDIVESSIRSAMDSIKSSNLPPDVKDKLEKRLDKVKQTVKNRLAHMDVTDLDQLGDELGKMGDEIGKQMDEFGKEMEKYGQQMGKQWQGKHWHVDFDNDDDDDQLSSVPDIDDQDDLDEAVKNLGDLSLKGPQRDQIQKLRADSDRQVAAAKKQLDQAADALKKQLDNVSASDADIARAIDAVTQQEAAIRKARILAWHGARRVLDDAQRKKVEDAASKAKKSH